MRDEIIQNNYEIIAVSNRKLCTEDFFECIRFAINDGADYLILREKDLSYEDYVNFAIQTKEFADDLIRMKYNREKCRKEKKFQLILNTGNFTDITVIQNLITETGCSNIHVPFFRLKDNRELQGIRRITKGLLGMSVHSREEAVLAEEYGADYIIAGHIFQTSCKQGLIPRGLDFLKEVCESVHIPVYAIGGMDKENAPLAVRAGAKGICIMSGYFR
ncbi:MAG: thiamine phosphate synthase [Lachnospiraceae bacterium]|nr:thiamine phosphate synthase [Lachnospiraceae bacterium]